MKLIDCMTEIQYMGIPINNVQATEGTEKVPQ